MKGEFVGLVPWQEDNEFVSALAVAPAAAAGFADAATEDLVLLATSGSLDVFSAGALASAAATRLCQSAKP